MNKWIIYYLPVIFSISAVAQDISGDWTGEMELKGSMLGISFHLTSEKETIYATMDIPKQGLTAFKADSAIFVDSTLTLVYSAFKMKYTGHLNPQNEIIGTLNQGGIELPLNLKKGIITLNRPQTPKVPFPYYSEDVIFENKTAGIKLAGTLTLPQKEGNFPVAIIISGSGPQNRNGEMFGHQFYFVLADYLTRNGIGVFRYDERGVGNSEGEFATAGVAEFSTDVDAALYYLETRKEVNPSKIGLIGHSLGGIIAPKMAATNPNIDFVVMLAGPGMDGDKLMLLQKALFEKLMGYNEFQVAQGQDLMKGAYSIIVNSNLTNQALKDSINSFYITKYGTLIPEEQRNQLVEQLTSAEIVSLIKNKPTDYLEKVSCPILVLNGSKDFQVPPKENLAAIKQAMGKSGNKQVKIIELKDLNHLFQPCKTGAFSEYAEIEQTFSMEALELIAKWVNKQTK